MKKVFALLLPLLLATASFAVDNNVVHWRTIIGVITAPGVPNPVAGIASGGLPWTTTGGQATVDLSTGNIEFQVSGLVLNGGNSSGTTGGVADVKGTLVCNPGSTTAQAVLDTAMVPLSTDGDAAFRGNLGTIPSPCATPLFLIRIPANDHWVATGAVER